MKILTSVFIILLSIFLHAQPTDFNRFMTGAQSSVYALAVSGGYSYVGGAFTSVGPNDPYLTKISTTSVSPDLTFARPNGVINIIVSDGNGGWYIGGTFTRVESYSRNRAAHILSDGSVDPNWNPDLNNEVRLLVYDVLGRLVQSTSPQIREKGFHTFEFNERGLASGVYIYRLEYKASAAGSIISDARRMIVLK